MHSMKAQNHDPFFIFLAQSYLGTVVLQQRVEFDAEGKHKEPSQLLLEVQVWRNSISIEWPLLSFHPRSGKWSGIPGRSLAARARARRNNKLRNARMGGFRVNTSRNVRPRQAGDHQGIFPQTQKIRFFKHFLTQYGEQNIVSMSNI